MVKQIEQIKKERLRNGTTTALHQLIQQHQLQLQQQGIDGGGSNKMKSMGVRSTGNESYEIIALHISPDLGERILLSAERTVLDEIFPETTNAIMDARSGVSWNQFDGRQVIRFPLNGYCKLNSIQVLTRLLNAGFNIAASTGGGVESQQFSEYLLVRKSTMWYLS